MSNIIDATYFSPDIDFSRPPDDHIKFPSHDFVMFYYGALRRELATLPYGTTFVSVNSPNPFVDPQSELYPWCYITFEIRECTFRKGQVGRGFAQTARRLLQPWQIELFEPLWRKLCAKV